MCKRKRFVFKVCFEPFSSLQQTLDLMHDGAVSWICDLGFLWRKAANIAVGSLQPFEVALGTRSLRVGASHKKCTALDTDALESTMKDIRVLRSNVKTLVMGASCSRCLAAASVCGNGTKRTILMKPIPNLLPLMRILRWTSEHVTTLESFQAKRETNLTVVQETCHHRFTCVRLIDWKTGHLLTKPISWTTSSKCPHGRA